METRRRREADAAAAEAAEQLTAAAARAGAEAEAAAAAGSAGGGAAATVARCPRSERCSKQRGHRFFVWCYRHLKFKIFLKPILQNPNRVFCNPAFF